MRFFATTLALSTLTASALAAVTPLLPIQKYAGETSGGYIVTLKDGASKAALLNTLKIPLSAVTYQWDIINGLAGKFDQNTLNALRADPNVESVSEDGIMRIVGQQTNAPWGLERISSNDKPVVQDPSLLTFTYTYDNNLGKNVDIYIVDTGIDIDHKDFGGRARWGASFGLANQLNKDGHGHGTHCAGTAAGSRYGVAKEANLIAVKVLSDAGLGSTSDIISGLNWVMQEAAKSGRASVVSMSLGGGADQTLDDTVKSLTDAGIHVVVAAGNDGKDAQDTSPARAPSAITVGASTIADVVADFSNIGSVVDIFAPGQDIISTWTSPKSYLPSPLGPGHNETERLSGTSMATPHVAGIVARIRSSGKLSVEEMDATLKSTCLKGVLENIPSGTIDCLAHI